MDGISQNGIESLSCDSDGEYTFLVGFCAPSGAEHHPEEIRLDPAHSIELEFSAEMAMACGEVTDGGLVCLIDDYRLLIELGENMVAVAGPSLHLGDIGLCNKGHSWYHRNNRCFAVLNGTALSLLQPAQLLPGFRNAGATRGLYQSDGVVEIHTAPAENRYRQQGGAPDAHMAMHGNL